MFLFWIVLALSPIILAYRLVDPDGILFWAGLTASFFQIGIFYGPSFSTIQELAPPQIRATVIAFYLLTLNLLGLGAGITLSGMLIDYLMALGVAQPYTWTLFALTVLSLTALPFFLVAGRHYAADKERLASLSTS